MPRDDPALRNELLAFPLQGVTMLTDSKAGMACHLQLYDDHHRYKGGRNMKLNKNIN
jgi:hypothetical protein